ncbi:MAG: formate dehydrogenase subunit gamma [Acidimicrobiaceae bacterium]|nr:formate dehydrogenase subunit gamma [Acidimicrobiaceae bacterium]
MAATTRRSPEPAGAGRSATTVVRFDRPERIIHWVNAGLFGIMLFTAASLYLGPLSALVGRRELVKSVHVYTGLLLPVPVLLGFLLRRQGCAFRRDAARLNRWTGDDRRWLRTLGRDPSVELGKFNPGQKLNAAFTLGAIWVMLATGSIMRWFKPFPLSWRTGATFVHDSVFIALVFTIAGHIFMATRDPQSMAGMRRGMVSRQWARTHHPRWYEELEGPGRGTGG